MSAVRDELERDLAWREAELASLKIEVARADRGTVRHSALLRALWAMLYAHYEGFTRFAWDLYLDALEALSLPRSSIRTELAQFSLESTFRSARKDLSPAALWTFVFDDCPRSLSEPATFAIRLETQSNLWPNLFIENAKAVGLPYTTMDEATAHIRALVSRRNDIAHGKRMVIRSLSEYQKYEDAVFKVLIELASAIDHSLESSEYLESNSSSDT